MKLSDYSERKLVGVRADLVRVVRRAAELAGDDKSVDFVIVQGKRTQAEQNALYAQGRTRPGKKVTWTRNSKHIGGGAIDFAALDANGKISWNEKLYPPIAHLMQKAAEAEKVGVEWGGEWKNKDWGHIQLNPVKLNRTSEAGGLVVPPFKLLFKGMEDARIEELQIMLAQVGFAPGPIDDDFGKLTDSAVRAYQGARKITVDGKVGPITWSLLKMEVAKKGLDKGQTILPGAFQAGPNYDRVVRFYEGERLEAYRIGGLWHIGIGHHGAHAGQRLTVREMNDLFAADTAERDVELNRLIRVPLTQKQYDAVASLYFNRPRTFKEEYIKESGVLPGDDLLEAINDGDFNKAELEFLDLIYAPALDGVVYSGLVARRRTEADLWAGREYELG